VMKVDAACPGATAGACYAMYYVGLSARYRVNCVAVAVAGAPGGPYADVGPLTAENAAGEPIGCGDAAGSGNIDPSPFTDPVTGQAYLYVSTDHRCAAGRCRWWPTLSVIPLAPDRLHAAGPRAALVSARGGIVEGPALASTAARATSSILTAATPAATGWPMPPRPPRRDRSRGAARSCPRPARS
jgi:hypothetical protein